MVSKCRFVVALAFAAAVCCGSSALGGVGSGPAFDNPNFIAREASGDLVVADAGLGAVVRVDPVTVTGDRVIVSQGVTLGFFSTPNGIAVEADGRLVVADSGLNAVVRIDPVTGVCAIHSDAGNGAGTGFVVPFDIAREASGDLVVTDQGLDAVVRVDPVTGDRTIVSDAGTGVGPAFVALAGIAVEASGDLVVTDYLLNAVVRVDPVIGDRTIVSDAGTGAGPTFVAVAGIAVEASGDFVVTDYLLAAVFRVDPVTGDRYIVADAGTGAGPAFSVPLGIAVEASGDFVVTDQGLYAVLRVDPVTGDRMMVSNAGTGAGPAFSLPLGIAVEASGDLVVTDQGLDAVVRVDPITGDRTVLDCEPLCGNGSIDPGEECDGGTACTDCVCGSGFEPTSPPSLNCQPICGNGSVDPGEECDGGTGCTDCVCNIGFEPTSPPSLNCQPRILSTIYVDVDATGANNGSSWEDAFNDLQDALDLAAVLPNETTFIWVAEGVYSPSVETAPGDPRSATFQLIDGVEIHGGYAGDGAPDPNARDIELYETILSGDIGAPDDDSDNCYHVVTAIEAAPTAVLDGFTITDGRADAASPDDGGGGMDNSGSTGGPTVSRCTFTGNYAYYGAGMHNLGFGGGPIVTHCTFSANEALYAGGGMDNTNASPTVTNCRFTGNSGGWTGGGMYGQDSFPSVINCTFSGNTTSSGGGAVYSQGPVTLTVTNSILWGNSPPQIFIASGSEVVTYSCVEGGWTGIGNIEADPLFEDADGRIDAGSPCIDAGDNTAVPVYVTTDLDGHARRMDDPYTVDTGNGTPPIVDMGAYEFVPTIYVDADAPGRANDGSSWQNAFTDLQDALALSASLPNQTTHIRVAEGVYVPSAESDPGVPRSATFQLLNGVGIYGGYAGYGAPDPDARDVDLYETILSGDLGTPGANSDNCYHVVRGIDLGAGTVLDGFTVTAGNSNGAAPHNCGGGMLAEGTDYTVTDCTFIGNASGRHGGGAYVSGDGATVTNCMFSGNSAPDYHGGGLMVVGSVSVANSTFHANTAHWGAGICTSGGNPTVTNCTFAYNAANFCTGGLYNLQSSTTVNNCVFWGNTAPWEPQIAVYAASVTVSYSDVQGGWTGTGNINADPLFLDSSGDDFRLGCSSPCVDAGDNSAVPGDITTDLAGEPRFVDDSGVADTGAGVPPIVDMGAYEQQLDSSSMLHVPDDYGTIQGAIARACAGAEIVVSPGTYNEAIDFMGKAIALRSAEGRQVTTIDATGLNASVVKCVSGEGPDTVLTGFTITGGTGTDPGDGLAYGGGMYNVGSSATVRDCIFIGNSTRDGADGSGPGVNGGNAGHGAGMYNYDSAPTVTDCIFEDNSTGSGGDGGDSANGGNGGNGGGMYNSGTSAPTVFNCIFRGNHAGDGGAGGAGGNGGGGGGGVGMCNWTGSAPTITNCIFEGNTAGTGGSGSTAGGGGAGGAMYDHNGSAATATNCIFIGNSCPAAAGGAIYNRYGNLTLTNCTFTGNSGTFANGLRNAGTTAMTVDNCIFWGDTVSEIEDTNPGTVTVTYSDVQGGYTGTGNIDADPLLEDADGRIDAGSPCIDAGDNTPVPVYVTTDLDGHTRRMDDPYTVDTGNGTPPIVDMGAYEFVPRIHVDADAPGRANDGSSWQSAFTDLQDALEYAASLPSELVHIRVAEGVYVPSVESDPGVPRSATFQLLDGVGIYGGYAGYGALDPDARGMAMYETILTGDIGTPDANSDNCYHVVRGGDLGSTTVLDGFTVTAGNSNGADWPHNAGGGMLAESGSYTVTNCTFTGNVSGRNGGGAHLGGSPMVTNCTFSGNTAVLHGGGLRTGGGSPTVANCTFHGNAGHWGGAMNTGGTPTVTNCTFAYNTADFCTGGLYNLQSSTTVTNCVFWGNTAPWEPQIATYEASVTVSYSDVQGGWTGTGNINADPLFADGDGRLRAGSPCIDAGDNTAVTVPGDRDGYRRVMDGDGDDTATVDMGAYEYWADCNENDMPDACDLDCSALEGFCNLPDCGLSSDDDESGVPDECECYPSAPGQAERLTLPGSPISKKIRYLSFSAGDTGRSRAVRVTFQNVPAPYAHWNGTQLWVQEPKRYCENAGQKTVPSSTNPPNYGCGSSGGISPPWFWGANLGCDPYYGDWTTYGVVHVWNEGVIPLGVYDIQVIDSTCSPDTEASYSTALTMTQSRWADLIKDCTTNPCGPPDNSTGIVDVTAVLDKWKNLPGNVSKARADIEGSPSGDHRLPDQAVNITDVTYCLGAFLGQTYPPPGFPAAGNPPVCP